MSDESKAPDVVAKAKGPLAYAGGIVGGGSVVGLLVSMGMSNNTEMTQLQGHVERLDREIESIQAVMDTRIRRMATEMGDRLRPLEIEASRGDRFTKRDSEDLVKRMESLERYAQWLAGQMGNKSGGVK